MDLFVIIGDRSGDWLARWHCRQPRWFDHFHPNRYGWL